MKKIILLFIGIVICQTTHPQTPPRIDWNSDLDYLAKELPTKHYNLFSKLSPADFAAGIEEIKAESRYLSDFETALKLQQLIAKAGDSHTMLNFTRLVARDRILMLQLFWASDGLYVLRTSTEHPALLGRRIVAINNIPIATVVDSLSTLLTIDNRAIVKNQVTQFFPAHQLLEYFGIVDGPQVELTLDGDEKYVFTASELKDDGISFRPDSLSFAMENKKELFTERYFPEEKIYYMLYNACWNRELESEHGSKEKAEMLPSFDAFTERAFNTLANKLVDKIIFDLRNNGGGNSAPGTAFIEKLAEFLREHPHIKTYVVLGRKTFSSAILNAMDFEKMTDAVFVGEETAGKPNHFGEVRVLQLPNSGLSVSYSTKYFKQTDEELDTLTPDVVIETSFDDFAKGIDPVYEWIKAQPAANRPNPGVN